MALMLGPKDILDHIGQVPPKVEGFDDVDCFEVLTFTLVVFG